MPTIKRFEDLECWKEARGLVRLVYKMTSNGKFKKDTDLARQLRRSAVSAMANIAEGFHRNSSKEFMRFLDYARTSVAETISHCYAALDQKYITEDEMTSLREQADTVWKKINGFLSYLHKIRETVG